MRIFYDDGLKRISFEDQRRPSEWRLELAGGTTLLRDKSRNLRCFITTHLARCMRMPASSSCLAADLERILATLANGISGALPRPAVVDD